MRFLLFLLLAMFVVLCQGQVVVSDPGKIVNLAPSAEYIEDPYGSLTIDDLIHHTHSLPFKRVGKEVIGFGLTPSYFWIKSSIRNETEEKLFIKIGSNPLTDIQVFETSGEQLKEQFHAGNWVRFNKREVKNIDYLFPLQVQKNSSTTVYIRAMHFRGTQFPLSTGTLTEYYVLNSERIFVDGIYYGLMLLMILYNLFIHLSLKDTSYLYYIAYVFLIALLNASMDGYAFQYFWPSFPAINAYEDIIAALVGISGILFVTHFLNTKANAPLLHTIFICLFVAYVATIAIIGTKHFLIGSSIMETVALISVACTFLTAYLIMRKGYKPAKFFLIAWSLLLVSIIIFILKDFNLVPYNYLTTNSLKIGSGAEALLLSIALADRINLYRKEKAEAQKELIQSLREKTTIQQEMLELEAKALRSQMNPHFIFNCMNSIKALIQQKEEEKAVSYLTTFSKLLRTILQNLDKREISLFDELETCRLYTHLESMRFKNKFSYSFSVDAGLDIKSVKVPALILQPFIENAIWHGIMAKEEESFIKVTVEKKGEFISCIIDDNGIGREASLKRKFSDNNSLHESKGVKLTQSRLDLDNALHKRNAFVKTIDKIDEMGNAAGTTIMVSFDKD